MKQHETAPNKRGRGRQELPFQNVESLRALANAIRDAAGKVDELADALTAADPKASMKVEYFHSLIDTISIAESFRLDGLKKINNRSFKYAVPAKRGRPKKDAK